MDGRAVPRPLLDLCLHVVWSFHLCDVATTSATPLATFLGSRDPAEGETVLAAITQEVEGRLDIRDVERPDKKAGEVLVKVHAASVNRLDRAVYEGVGLGKAASFPLIQGIDAAGVLETGGGALIIGRRVIVKPTVPCTKCRWCLAGQDADCANATTFGIHRAGGFAEYIAVPKRNIVYLPSSLSFTEGAAAAHVHPVVLRMMRAAGKPSEGDTVLVTGAGGALGTAAIQLATIMGARVIAVDTSPDKAATAEALGAGFTITVDRSNPRAGFAEDVAEATEGAGVDLVLDATGSPRVIAEAASALGRGGRLALVASPPGETIAVDLHSLYRNRQAIIGSAGSSRKDVVDALRMLSDHDVHPVIAATYPLAAAADAMERMVDPNRIGKVVLEVGETG